MTTQAFQFNDHGNEAPEINLVGDKIRIDKLFEKPIQIHKFKIEPSKVIVGTKCLWLQISKGEEMYVVFTASTIMINQLENYPKDRFPVNAMIVKRPDGSYAFVGTQNKQQNETDRN